MNPSLSIEPLPLQHSCLSILHPSTLPYKGLGKTIPVAQAMAPHSLTLSSCLAISLYAGPRLVSLLAAAHMLMRDEWYGT